MIFGGKLFQSLIVLGQKLYLYSSHDVCIGINFIGSKFLVFMTVLCFMIYTKEPVSWSSSSCVTFFPNNSRFLSDYKNKNIENKHFCS